MKALPTDPAERKKYPMGTGVLDYFPDAIAEIARVSFEGNEQHNPGQPLHWDRSKSMDQSDTMIRHYLERGTRDTDGMRHSAKMAWRALALLQLEIENETAVPARSGPPTFRDPQTRKKLCWALCSIDGYLYASCMLPAGHDGDHYLDGACAHVSWPQRS